MGYDGVSLYLSCIASKIPSGFPIRRMESTGFKPEIRDRSLCTIYWLECLNRQCRYNTSGLERSLANFRFDGFEPEEITGYDLYGCWYHGHKMSNKMCYLSKKMDPILAEERYERTKSRETYIKKHCKLITKWECSYYNLSKTKHKLSLMNLDLNSIELFFFFNVRDFEYPLFFYCFQIITGVLHMFI